MASTASQPMRHCQAQQAVHVAEQKQQQQQPYYHHQVNGGSNLNRNGKNDAAGHYHCPALIEDNNHRTHSSHHLRHQHVNQKRHQFQQQQYQQLPTIVNEQQHSQQQNGCDGASSAVDGPPKREGATGRGGGAGGGGVGCFSFSSSSSTTTPATAASAIIVVDPPRPPFIPKKPVLNGSGGGGGGDGNVVVDEHHHHHPQQRHHYHQQHPHHHPHHHKQQQQQHNRIYAQANCGGNGGGVVVGGSGGTSATVNSTLAAAMFDGCSAAEADGTATKMITQTTTTYIGSGGGGGGTGTIGEASAAAGLRRTAVATTTKSQQQQIPMGMIDDSDNNSNTTEQYRNGHGGGGDDQQHKLTDQHDYHHRDQSNWNGVKALSGGNNEEATNNSSAANNNNSSNTNRNSFGTESSFSAGSSTIVSAAVADQPGLHYSVTGMFNQQSNNNVEKTGGITNNRPQRRLSLVGGVALKLPDYQRLPISSFGCTTNGHGREGRIYATAGLGGGNNESGLTVKKNSTAAFLSNGCGVGGAHVGSVIVGPAAAAVNNKCVGGSIFGLRNGIQTTTSYMCLNGIGGGPTAAAAAVVADGKSTLSRRAQKLAQKAAHKLTIGSLSSELSSSASALYSLFTSSAECGGGGDGRGGTYAVVNGKTASASSGTASDGLGIYAETYLGREHFYHDKAPIVSAHTSRGIDFLERFGQFAKERALIEEEYASKLKSLAKRSRGKKNGEDSEEAKMYTTTMAFQTMLAEMESLASQHEVIGERLRSELCPQLTEKCRQLRASRKKLYQDYEMMEKNMQTRQDELAKQKKNYEKAHFDAQGAHVKCAKAEKNMYITRMDLEKARQNVNTKNGICEQNKQNYAAQLGATNKAKYEHFNIMMPQLLEQMRQLDIERIEFTKKSMLDCVAAETGVLNIIQRCYSDMNSAIGTISPEKDTLAVVEQTKSGFGHPLDYEFEDLGNPADILQDGTESFDGSTMKRPADKGKSVNGKGGGVPRKQSLKLFGTSNNHGKSNGSGGAHGGTNCGAGGATIGNGSGGGSSEYGTLPPQQRCRKIQQKLEELEADLNIKDQSQAGMQRMHVAYSQNPQLGDPAKVAEQLLQNQQEMHMLQQQIQRFKELLQIAQGELNQPLGASTHNQHHLQHHYASATAHSSPGSSPRGSAGSGTTTMAGGKLKNGHGCHQNGGRFNGTAAGTHLAGAAMVDHHQLQQHRVSSYSEASSISSADGGSSMVLAMNNSSGGNSLNGGSASAFHHSASGAMLLGAGTGSATTTALANATATASTASLPPPPLPSSLSQCPAPQQQQQNEAASEMFYEECDTPAARGDHALDNGGIGGCSPPTAVVPPQQHPTTTAAQQQSDIVLGTAVAMYPYEATSDDVDGTTISMRDGDELLLLERDVGDGWTRVRHIQSNAEGFVPTSYLECKWYSTDGQ